MSSPYSDCPNCPKNVFMAFFFSSARLQIKFMHYIWLVCWTNIRNKQSSWARIISKLEWKRPLQLRQLLGPGLEVLTGTFVPSLWCPLTNQWEELESGWRVSVRQRKAEWSICLPERLWIPRQLEPEGPESMASCSGGRKFSQDFVNSLECEPVAAGLRDGGQLPGGLGTLWGIGADLEYKGPGIRVFTLTSFSASHFIPFENEQVLWTSRDSYLL